jgi:two-component system, OmpR family, KDP operon response regulator KdpE
MRILLVEDELQLQAQVRADLERQGYTVDATGDGKEALYFATEYPFDAAVVDLGLPGLSGLEVIRRLRADGSRLPILVLTARARWQDKVEGLEAGADDYLTKPFGVAELSARLRAMLRRGTRTPDSSATVVKFDDVVLDLPHRVVTRGGAPVHLTPIEFRLLAHLAVRPNKVLTHRHLLRELWGPSHVEHVHYLRIYMANLRRKLEADAARPRHLLTETGIGYRFLP